MTSIVTDFKSIRLKVERLEQKAQADKEQAAVDALKASLQWPYGVSVPFELPDLREKADALAQQLLDNYALCSAPPLDWLKAKI